jgi:hypothetical protein
MRPDRKTEARGILIVTLLILTSMLAGCVEDPISPSLVTKLRILGLQPDPPEPAPGDSLSLELLWTDTRPSCEEERDCEAGQRCEAGQCLRPSDNVEMIWIVSSISAWQSSEEGFGQLFSGFGGGDLPGTTEEQCQELRDLYELCSALTCVPLGPVTICCGDEGASRVAVDVPSDPAPPPTCDSETSFDTSAVLQIQAQVCIGGQLNLCDADLFSLSFGCEGEGAETVIASSRVRIATEGATPNSAPTIVEPTWGRLAEEDGPAPPDPVAWDEDLVPAIQGCQGNNCASRQCRSTSQCRENQVCDDGRCREVFSVAMAGGAQETFLGSCEEATRCEEDSDCEAGRVCEGGSCLRIENPVAAFYATSGSFTPGRVVLDTTGNGRPDEDRFTTRWLPPTLDPCEAEGDLCSFGQCDPELRLCTGEVDLWVVARDGRGGQSWIERRIRIVP